MFGLEYDSPCCRGNCFISYFKSVEFRYGFYHEQLLMP